MKKAILIAISFLVFAACDITESKREASIVQEVPVSKSEFSNPGFMVGSSFGEFFISMIRTQNYNMALKFTSKGSIDKYSSKIILDKYSNFKYNYVLAQHSITQVGDTFTVTYATNEMATGKLKKLTLVLENDTCKLVLPDNLENLLK